ncbi:VWA domain-containing protein, partial [Nostoc sp. NIES-2111]
MQKFLSVAVLLASGWATPRMVGQETEAPVVFRSDVALARVDAQVSDRVGRPITTLTKDDFEIRERGTLREITSFSREDMPLDVLILLDVSGSMRPHVERIASATREALLVLSRKDRVAIMVFDRQTRTSMPFRSNQDEIVRGMQAVLEQEDFNGGTDITRALYDATRFMNSNARREARRAIVILTDDRTERG